MCARAEHRARGGMPLVADPPSGMYIGCMAIMPHYHLRMTMWQEPLWA
jgi:hypothetical protein